MSFILWKLMTLWIKNCKNSDGRHFRTFHWTKQKLDEMSMERASGCPSLVSLLSPNNLYELILVGCSHDKNESRKTRNVLTSVLLSVYINLFRNMHTSYCNIWGNHKLSFTNEVFFFLSWFVRMSILTRIAKASQEVQRRTDRLLFFDMTRPTILLLRVFIASGTS
jgi:hypothetical protein